ncbi:GcrA family cell cycle regulator [Enterovirga rhinocerotis]|uniref:GcrA cell cycle regulator n=1 Tax=Enterovirga rhinocerotis TaxID=1339210 RepID=A0A4R7BNV0_9HYPH|nr:GcrA family cell cycle regulator [Enterovirga rhinocerotis]TDR87220.1 GcrA cell cycle regulator [Enterovirga rhinocerotis]
MSDAVTGWTDERVELLGKLWSEGLSASQIAAALGGGVTRNAVIGKVHRLGLSGRTKGSQPPAPRAAKPRAPSAPGPVQELRPRTPEAPPPEPASATVLVLPPAAVVPAAEPAIPVSERISIMELRETTCRWPLGDPTSADFGFCGGRSVTGLPYCEAHCRIAYQPAAERKRLRA